VGIAPQWGAHPLAGEADVETDRRRNDRREVFSGLLSAVSVAEMAELLRTMADANTHSMQVWTELLALAAYCDILADRVADA
jgi:hypothetical protein